MKKTVFTILMSLTAMCGMAQCDVEFEGQVNVEDGTVVYFWSPENNDYKGEAVDTIVNDRFYFKRKLTNTDRYMISLGGKEEEFPICMNTVNPEGSSEIILTFTGSNPHCSTWKLDVSKPSAESKQWKLYDAYIRKRCPVYMELYDKASEIRDVAAYATTKEEKDSLFQEELKIYHQQEPLDVDCFNATYEYVKTHPSSPVWSLILYQGRNTVNSHQELKPRYMEVLNDHFPNECYHRYFLLKGLK